MNTRQNCAVTFIMALLVTAAAGMASAWWGNSKDISADGRPQAVEPAYPEYVDPTTHEDMNPGWRRGYPDSGDKHHDRFHNMIVDLCYDRATRHLRSGFFRNDFGMGRVKEGACCNNSVKWCKSARRATSMDRLVEIKRLNGAVMETRNGLAGRLHIAHAIKRYKRATFDALETRLRCEVVAGKYCAHENVSLSACRAIHDSWMEEEKMLGRIFYEIARTQDVCKGLERHSEASKYKQVVKSTTTAKISTASREMDARTKQLCSRDWNARARAILHLMRDLDTIYSRTRMENGCKKVTYRSFWNEHDKKYDVKPQEAVYGETNPQKRTMGNSQ